MIFLILAILCSTLITVLMRVSEKHISKNTGMLTVNYIVCVALAFAMMPEKQKLGGIFSAADGGTFALFLGLGNGFLYLVSFMMLQWNIKKNGVVLSSLFMKLGILVPLLISMIAFGENPGTYQIFGIAAALVAILIMNTGKQEHTEKAVVGLIVLLLIGGSGDTMSKVYEELGSVAWKDAFLFVTFLSALVLCTMILLIRERRMGKADLLFGLLIGIPNYFSARFLLRSLSDVPAVVAYPTYSVATIVLITMIGFLVFHEKLDRRKLIGVAIIPVAILLLNLS